MRLSVPGSLIHRSREYASLGRQFCVEQGAHGQQACQRTLVGMNFERVSSFAFGHAFASTQILGAQDGIAVGKIGHPLPAPDEFESDRMTAQVTARADDQRQFAAFGDKIAEVIGIADSADQPGDVLPYQFQQVGALFCMLAFPPRAAVSKLGGDFIVDPAGIIRLAYRSHNPTDRPPMSQLLMTIRQLGHTHI